MNVTDIDIKEFDYPLPDERIARHPLAERDRCRMLVRDASGRLADRTFADVAELLPADSMLIYNNTRVINARLHFRKPSGGVIEIFCLEPAEPADYAQSFASTGRCSWKCFVGNSKRWKEGSLSRELTIGDITFTLTAERVDRLGKASIVRFDWDAPSVTFSQIVSAIGEIPIPPYLNRESEASDAEDYQTVFGRIEGSVAAPTAGLHFTDALLEEVDRRGIERRELTLHVGAGTFQPVQSDTIGGHEMHREFIEVSLSLIEELATTDRRIVAVGTTSVRTLESLYQMGCRALEGLPFKEVPQWYAYGHASAPTRRQALTALADALRSEGSDRLVASTSIIIAPGYDYRVVDAIITNFHQPCSTLLLLVSAFTGGDWRPAYDHALAGGYRFLSYGDSMLLLSWNMAD